MLDTNIISEVMRPAPEPRVMAWLRKQPLNTLATTAITLAEIRYGLGRLPEGQRRRNLEERFRAFLVRGFYDRIMAFDAAAAEIYSAIVIEREKAGPGRRLRCHDCGDCPDEQRQRCHAGRCRL